ncbi:MAG: hypothetical protein ACI837_000769 [Crocinitomicaceae bacterium]|jgi:hypothetical protein
MKDCQVFRGVNSSAKRKVAARNTRRKDIIAKSAQKFKLNVLFFLIIISSNSSTAQSVAKELDPTSQLEESPTRGIELSIGINRLDYLLGIGYTNKIGRAFQLNSGLEVGLGRTFAQGRFNPRFSLGMDYLMLQRERIKLGPSIGYAYSYLQLNKSTHSYHHWHEVFCGYSLEIGKNWRFTHRGMMTGMSERFKSQVTNKSEAFRNFGFYAKVGIKYCW